MRPLRKGHIVLIGSMSADLRSGGSSIYAATKSGIQAFAEALRKEVNPEGIKVSLIEPGKTGSDMVEESPSKQRDLIHKHEHAPRRGYRRCRTLCAHSAGTL